MSLSYFKIAFVTVVKLHPIVPKNLSLLKKENDEEYAKCIESKGEYHKLPCSYPTQPHHSDADLIRKWRSDNKCAKYRHEPTKIRTTRKTQNAFPCKSSKQWCELRKNLIFKESKNNIYSGLDYLIYKKGVKNISNKLEVKNKLVESIMDRKQTSRLNTKLTTKTLAYTLSENYNKEFSKLSVSDKKVLSEVLSTKPQVLKEEINKTKETILSRINTLVKESNEENLKAKLTQTKNVVIKMKTDKLSLLKLKQLVTDLN